MFAALAGLTVFSLMIDPSIINPLQVDWLANGDPAQSYLGWLFFRHEPWSLPLGLTHMLGMEQASSIVYSDSIPLLAIPFKAISGWLPHDFQYHGIWLFGCYALQGYFACRLLMLFSMRSSVLIGGVLLFLLSPIMLLRAQSHFALAAHWIVVAAIYLYYAPVSARRFWHWLALLWLAPLVHAYLMLMAYAIFAAYLLRQLFLDTGWKLSLLSAWAASAIMGSLAMMWLAGYFCDMEVSTGGFGYYSMNLLAPWLPVGVGPFMMSAPVAATTGQYEGFNYLGLGVVSALAFAVVHSIIIVCRPARARADRWIHPNVLPLLLCCLTLTLLAVSSVVTFGSHTLLVIPLPAWIDAALNVFRASGRLFWPVYYLLLLTAVRSAANLSATMCVRLLVVVLALQVVDLWPFLHAMHRNSEIAVIQNRFPAFESKFWKDSRKYYDNIYVIPGEFRDDSQIPYESLAGRYGFAIDSAYYARMPSLEHRLPRQKRHTAFFQGELDENGIYLIQPESKARFAMMQRLLPPDTGVGEVDGFTVVAPAWFAHVDTKRNYLKRAARPDFPSIELGRDFRFGEDDAGTIYALAGWSEPGNHAVWSVGTSVVLIFHVAAVSNDLHIALQVMPYLPAAFPRLGVDVRVDGQPLAHWEFERGKPPPATVISVPAASLRAQNGNVALRLNFDQPRSPFQSGESTDTREIALLLQGMELTQP